MIRGSRSATIFILDIIIIYVCFLGVFIYKIGFGSIPLNAVILMAFIALTWFVIALNSSVATVNIESKMIETLKGNLIGYSVLSAGTVTAVAVFGEFAPINKLILWPLFYAFILSSLIRLSVLIALKQLVKEGYYQKSVLLIGSGRVAAKVANQILSSSDLGYRLYGYLTDNYDGQVPKKFYIGKLEKFKKIVRSREVDEVIIALPLKMEETIVDMVEKCEYEGIRAHIVPDFFRIIRNRSALGSLGDIPLIGIRIAPLDLLKNRVLKRCSDIVISLTVLVLLSPLFLILGIIIKLTSPGPVFFKQERIGVNNRSFKIIKFRSMYIQDHQPSNTQHTTVNDSRITPFGKFIRKHSLDELPQFWNVLNGDMSVVGPRPELTHFADRFGKDIARYRVRHLVKSGITGLAQANGWRGNTSIVKRVEHDIYYLENWSFWLDLKILFLTIFNRKAWKNAI
jgi:Undecaprenyl-phosphate glucose phosphotransferase